MPSARSLAIVDALDAIYRQSVTALREALAHYAATGKAPDEQARAEGAFAYPEIRLRYDGGRNPGPLGRAYGRLTAPGAYAVSVTQPALFRDYLAGQIDLLIDDFGAKVEIARGHQEIPFAYVLDSEHELHLAGAAAADLTHIFPAPLSRR
jgi:AMP nucleosidase